MTEHPCWVVFYHYVRESPGASPGIRALSPADFEYQLDWLAERATIIDYPRFARALRDRRGFPSPAVLLTFDDGLSDHLETVLPALEARGLSGVFFLNGGPFDDPPLMMNVHRVHLLLDAIGPERLRDDVAHAVARDIEAGRLSSSDVYRYDGEPDQIVKRLLNYELPYDECDRVLASLTERHLGDERRLAADFYLSRDDVRTMAKAGMVFGYHTRLHRVLSRLDRAGQTAELRDGVELVRELTGQRDVPFCFPYGHRVTFDSVTTELLEALGYAMAFTTVRAAARTGVDRRFELPRVDTRDLPPAGTLAIGLQPGGSS